MRFDHPEYHTKKEKCWFELSDKWTVREVLDYDSDIDYSVGKSIYIRLWNAVRAVLNPDDWHCEVPFAVSLDKKLDKKTLAIIKWACLAGWSARQAMNVDEKN